MRTGQIVAAGKILKRAGVMASALLALTGLSPWALAQDNISRGVDQSEGRAVYETHCASCHDNPEATRSPAFASLREMGIRAIAHSLTHGRMRANAEGLSDAQIDAVTAYLAGHVTVDNSWVERMACQAPRQGVDTRAEVHVPGWGIDPHNQRNMSPEQAGLSREDMPDLELKWALGFPQTGTMRAQPAIIGNTLFLSVADSGQLYALDITPGEKPCVQWVYDHGLPLRSSVGTGELADGTRVLVFGDAAAHVQMLDAAQGDLLWRKSVRVTSVANTTGMPVLHDGVVYTPVSSGELNMGAAPTYECCTSHGAVIALEAETGETVWEYHTMEDATPRDISRVGTQQWGPSGAPIWTTPAIDEARGLLYVGTGQNTSEPPTDTSDAVLAIRLADGSLAWQFQATENDIFLTGCLFEPGGPNCPPEYSVNADWDFGASMILTRNSLGEDIVLAGQKSGMLWALDPDTGKLLWQVDAGPGGPAGGIHWGMAVDDNRVFAAVNQVGMAGEPADREPGLHAFDIDDGERLWSFINEADCRNGRDQRLPSCDSNYGLSAATLVVDGSVIQGGNDGYLRIFDGADGRLLYTLDTTPAFETVNGIEASGGSIDNAAVIAAHGMLLVQSGYGLLGAPGNVLLALGPAEDDRGTDAE